MSHLHKERETELKKAYTNNQGSKDASREEELRRSEARYRALVEATSQAVWTWNPHSKTGEFADTQRWWAEITGQTPQEQSAEEQTGWLEAIHPDDQERVQTAWAQAMTTGTQYHVEYRLQPSEGEYIYIVARAVPIYESDGTVREWVGTLTDVTEKRRTEETLERERELLQKLFDRIPVMIAMYRPDTSVLQINKAFEQLTGWSTEEAPHIDLMERCYPDPAYREWVRLYMDSLQEGWRDITMMTKTGQPLESSWSNIHLSDETHIGIGIDITARKRTEEALSRSERLYRAIGESINYGIWVCEPDGRNIYASDSFLKLVGLTQEECSAFGWGKVLHPDEAKATMAAWEECARTGNFWEREHRFWGVDGRWHHILARGVPIRDEEGQIICWAGINLDIDNLKQTEQALRESEERLRASEAQLRLLNQTLEQRVVERTAELERSLNELDQFAYVASHDLKAPLRAVNHLATWIAEDTGETLPESSKIHLAKLQNRIQRMDKLLNDLLIYSRTGRRYYTKISKVNTGALVAEIVDLLAPPPGFTITIQENMPSLRTYPVLLELVFRNLIDNAIKYHHRPEGRIEISAQRLGDFIQFSVTDDGPGIEPAFHERIFQIFQTLQPRDDIESSGVGLAIVKKAVESQRGVVSLSSAPGQGSTFRFTWPADTILTQS
jgi:PAS domain S-box-containing protein